MLYTLNYLSKDICDETLDDIISLETGLHQFEWYSYFSGKRFTAPPLDAPLFSWQIAYKMGGGRSDGGRKPCPWNEPFSNIMVTKVQTT